MRGYLAVDAAAAAARFVQSASMRVHKSRHCIAHTSTSIMGVVRASTKPALVHVRAAQLFKVLVMAMPHCARCVRAFVRTWHSAAALHTYTDVQHFSLVERATKRAACVH